MIDGIRKKDESDVVFKGERSRRTFKGEYLIRTNSIYAQILADFIEEGHGMKTAKIFVN